MPNKEEELIKSENDISIEKESQQLVKKEEQENCIISDESLLGVYGEVMTNLRSDRDQISEVVDTFSNMVINDGDCSTSSKEALVNLIKTKIDTSDKMSKIADLMTRIKLKQPATFKPYMNGNKKDGDNTINIYDSSGINRKSLMERIQKEKDNEQK